MGGAWSGWGRLERGVRRRGDGSGEAPGGGAERRPHPPIHAVTAEAATAAAAALIRSGRNPAQWSPSAKTTGADW